MSIESDYIARHPGSASLYAQAARVLPAGVTHDARYLRPFPVYVRRAQGSRKWDVDGHELIDYVMGHGALLLGHNFGPVTEAAAHQLQLGTHYGAGHALEIAWAEEVVRLVPSAEVVRFTSSGTEATLMALRIARAATGRPTVLKFDRHFHGWHDYVAASSKYAGAAPAGVPQSTMESVIVVPPDMASVREATAGRDDIAAVIVEASGASAGTLPVPAGFLRELREHTAAQGIVMVMDEVVTGFRWSPGGVQQLEGVTPDITTLAKILAGGLPGGAVAGRRDLMELLDFPAAGSGREKVGHPGTFNANPLSAAAGVETLREIADGTHQQRADATARELRTGMNEVLAQRGIAGVVYGDASIIRICLRGERPPEARDHGPRDLPYDLLAAGTPPEVLRHLQLAMITRGVHLFGNGGLVSSVHSAEDVAATLEAWDGALGALIEEGHIRPC